MKQRSSKGESTKEMPITAWGQIRRGIAKKIELTETCRERSMRIKNKK